MPVRFDHGVIAGGHGLFALALFVVILAVIAWAVVTLLRHTQPPNHHASPSAPGAGASTAQRILDERFARGEIDAEEFTRRRDLLRSSL